MPTPHDLELALQATRDRGSFLKNLLIDGLEWPIPDHVESPEEIAYSWSAADLRTDGLDKSLVDGQVWQIQSLQGNQPWGIFLLEFRQPNPFISGRGLTGPLRKILRGLVPSRRQHSNLATWKRENLLFICTHQYQHFRFAYFKAPPDNTRTAPLAAFGWGPDMPARTACEFNLPALVWPHTGTNEVDWTDGWASAFDVEKVTKKFYEEYATIFAAVEKAIADENGLKDGEDLRMFTQTLVNRLMFLRFLERKGWLKFNGNEKYLRALYDAGPFGRKSFYRGRLMPLFFEGLAIEKHGPSDAFGEVPFLNGGLFEPNELDKRIKEVPYAALGGLIGDHGLFYRYNFTVEESTPLDIEVAVDPEMLGKVFEELVTGRHETGSYFTPRPIVSFMCREALKGHLASKTKASADSIAALVDRSAVEGLTEAHGRQILDALDSLKAVDPACGSGAYLLGLLHELVAIYRLLISEKLVKDRRSLYDLKLRIISHNLYGVDIDPFATNIAMLRLWLSLEVEADVPLPLPNLDFKIETGDSLLGPDPQKFPADLFALRLRVIAGEMILFKEKHMTSHGEEAARYHKAVMQLKKDIEDLSNTTHGEGVVDWWASFAEVFVENKGFDIVLANPPYVRMELFKDIKPKLRELFADVHTERADLYCYFYARSIGLLTSNGMIVFISSNKWFRAGYGNKLRKLISDRCSVVSITDFGELPVFQTAATFPMIFIGKRGTRAAATVFTKVKDLEYPYPDVLALQRSAGVELPPNSLVGDKWTFSPSTVAEKLRRMEQGKTQLREYVDGKICWGVKTGLNAAFVINTELRDQILQHDSGCKKHIKKLAIGDGVRKWRIDWQDQWLIYTYHGIPIAEIGAIVEHLKPFRTRLENRATKQKWYELQQPQAGFATYLQGTKIVFPDIAKESRFTLDTSGYFLANTCYFMPSEDYYLLGVLNSETLWNYCKERLTVLGDAEDGGRLRFFRHFVEALPIPDAASADRDAIAKLVKRCLEAQGQDSASWEKEIDGRVAALYGL